PGMPLMVFRTEINRWTEMHTHDFCELVVVLAGHGLHVTSDNRYPIAAGDVFVILSGSEHTYEDCKQLEIYNVLFDMSKLNLPVSDLYKLPSYHALFSLEPGIRGTSDTAPHHYLTLSKPDLDEIGCILARTAEELTLQEPGYQGMAVSLFFQTIIFLSRRYACITIPEPWQWLRLGEIMSYIEQHTSEMLTLAQLARIAGVSVSTLHRTFRAALGVSPMEYVIRRRLERAAGLLRYTDLTITEIASQTGFTDSNFFARQFRKRFGCAPRELRRSAV
ncbi:MAG: helix-turn-helix domain-containing protein, partial [bacterium]|nr:helix-turn-helix domain-containing protein [bacterium]